MCPGEITHVLSERVAVHIQICNQSLNLEYGLLNSASGFVFGDRPCDHAEMSAFCLGIHAGYQCQHTGACCQNWAVPAEPHVIEVVQRLKLRRSGTTGSLFLSAPLAGTHATGTPIVARDDHGDCMFFERDPGRLCVIHREAGIAALPSACRHFPRKVLTDARGTFISLSHYCPTAARLLLATHGLEIVEATAPLQLPPRRLLWMI